MNDNTLRLRAFHADAAWAGHCNFCDREVHTVLTLRRARADDEPTATSETRMCRACWQDAIRAGRSKGGWHVPH